MDKERDTWTLRRESAVPAGSDLTMSRSELSKSDRRSPSLRATWSSIVHLSPATVSMFLRSLQRANDRRRDAGLSTGPLPADDRWPSARRRSARGSIRRRPRRHAPNIRRRESSGSGCAAHPVSGSRERMSTAASFSAPVEPGGRDAVVDSHLVFVEIDAPDALGRLARFATPSMIVASGSPGHAHAYWTLRTPVAPAEVEHANRTLANHLGGDPASVDAARILRPAGTLSHKHRPPAPVELIHIERFGAL